MMDIVTPNPYTTMLINYKQEHIFSKINKAIQLTSDVEYEMVKLGLREANVFHLLPENSDRQIEQIVRDGLVFLPIHRTKRYGGFAHKHQFVEYLDQNSMSYGVVAKTLESAEKFRNVQLSQSTDHKATGLLLNYPECCSTVFEPYYQKSADPVWEVCEATEGSYVKDSILYVPNYDPNLFVHARYIGLKIIPWFPCNLLCADSIKRAKTWLQVLNSLDPETTEFIQEMLKIKGQTWDLLNAQVVVTIPNYCKIIATSDYQPERRIIKFI